MGEGRTGFESVIYPFHLDIVGKHEDWEYIVKIIARRILWFLGF